MGYMDMLTKFFKNNQGSADSNDRNIGEKFYLKPHAEKDFFSWVNQWSVMVKKPSDLGFSDERYSLPELKVSKHIVKNENQWSVEGQGQLFVVPAKRLTEVREEQKLTVQSRCEIAAELSKKKTNIPIFANLTKKRKSSTTVTMMTCSFAKNVNLSIIVTLCKR